MRISPFFPYSWVWILHEFRTDIHYQNSASCEIFGSCTPTPLISGWKFYNKLPMPATNEKEFYSREYPYGDAPGQLPKDDPLNLFGPAYTHPIAISIDALMSVVTGVELEYDPIYISKRNYHIADGGIDSLIGFNGNCIKGK